MNLKRKVADWLNCELARAAIAYSVEQLFRKADDIGARSYFFGFQFGLSPDTSGPNVEATASVLTVMTFKMPTEVFCPLSLVKSKFSVDRLELRWFNQLAVSHAHRMQGSI